MAEPQPETLSDNMYTALDIVGQSQLAHVGGYRDKIRLGVAMGRSGQNVRIGGMKHYVAERLQSGSKSPYIHYKSRGMYPLYGILCLRYQFGKHYINKNLVRKEH
jgi:hypothetical protein